MTSSRTPRTIRATGAALTLTVALLALLLSSLVATPASAHQVRPIQATPRATTLPPRGPHTPTGKPTWTPQQLAASRAKIAKLPKWKPNARILTSPGVTPRAVHNALAPNLAVPVTTDPNNWTALGPGPVNIGGVLETGAIYSVSASASNPNNLWIATGAGGLWHSNDGGATWTPMTDALLNQYPFIGGSGFKWVGVDPAHDGTIVAYADGLVGLTGAYDNGFFETTDGGATWTPFASALVANPNNVDVTAFAIDPSNDQIMLAAGGASTSPTTGTGGVWRTADDGASWTQTLNDPNFATGTAVIFDPVNSSIVFAATSTAVYQSLDGGATWSPLAGGPAGASVTVVSLAFSHDGARLYALATDNLTGLPSLYVWATSAKTWTTHDLSATPVASDPGSWGTNNVLSVSPADNTDNTVYLGSANLYRSTDGGVTWAQVSTSSVGTPLFGMVFPSASSENLVLATGEGVWSYTANTSTWANDNATLAIGYGVPGSYGDQGSDSPLIAGFGLYTAGGLAQYPAGHTGSAIWSPLTDPIMSQGASLTLDWSNNANVYGAITDCSASPCVARIYKSTTGGSGPFTLTGFSSGDATSGPALAISQVHPQTLFTGTTRLWETTDSGTTWNPISPQLDTTPGGGGTTCTGPSDPNCPTIRDIAVAPGSDSTITVTYDTGQVGTTYVTTDGGASWYSMGPICSGLSNCSSFFLTSVAISPANPQVMYAAGVFNTPPAGAVKPNSGCGPFCEFGPIGLFVSTNGGHTWSYMPSSATLPSSDADTVLAISPANPNFFVISGVNTVLVSFDSGLDWLSAPSAPVSDYNNSVLFSHDGSQLLFSTLGRGILAIALPHLTLSRQAITLTTPAGSSPASQQVTLGNAGQGALSWSTSGLPSWLSVSPSSGAINPGATQQVTLTFNTPSSTPQTYTTMLDFHTNADNPLMTLPVTVSSSLSKSWYFAEGYTGTGFTEYLTLANPNPVAANVSVTYLLQGQPAVTKSYVVNPNARRTLNVNTELGLQIGVSLVVTGDQPIIAERPMYFTFTGAGLHVPGGTDVLGATSLGTQFDFGYLDTTANHATYLTVLNQNAAAMTVSVSYYAAAGGSPTVVSHSVAANSRGTILVNGDVPAGSYSALVSLSAPGLVERPLYLTDATTGYTGSADVIGVQAPATNWSFAEGFTNPNFSERYLLSNPSTTLSAHATLTFLTSDGATTPVSVTIAPGAQQVVDANSVLGNGVNNSALVSSDQPILAERFMSFTYHGAVGSVSSSAIPGATDVLGATSVGQVYDFAEGYTGDGFGEYLTLENPQSSTTAVTVVYLPQSGATPTIATYFVAAHSRYTILTNTVMPNQSFSMVVLGSAPLVAERPMYFTYHGDTGGSDVVGYQP